MRLILKGARTLNTPFGVTLELCILTLCLPWEAIAIELDAIDWSTGAVPVPTRGGRQRLLHLPPAAIRTIVRVSGTIGSSGQAVTAGRGRRLLARDVRLDRLQLKLAADAPDTIPIGPWNFHGIRTAAGTALARAGCSAGDVTAAMGVATAGNGPRTGSSVRTDRDSFDRAVATIGLWNDLLDSSRTE